MMRAFLNWLRSCATLIALCIATPTLAQRHVADTAQPFEDVQFSVDEGTWMSVDVSPDGSTLAFDLLGHIYLLPATGGEARALRETPAFDRSPRFSPDGHQLAFLGDGDGYENAWIINVDGTDAHAITTEADSTRIGAPAWTADGEYVVAQRYSTSGPRTPHAFGTQLWLYHIAGGAGRMIVQAPNFVAEPTLSRDGRALYYTEDISPFVFAKPSPDYANFAIRRDELATGESTTLVSGYGGAFAARISPDGQSLAFVRRVATKDVLFVYDLKTGKQRAVFDGLSRDLKVHAWFGVGSYPSFGWFPDDRHVAIWAQGHLWNIDTVSGQARNIPFHARVRHKITKAVRVAQDLSSPSFAAKAIGFPALSPDGRVIVFGAVGHLWKKRLPDGKVERLTGDDDFAYDPNFSPDGRQILYVSWNDERGATLRIRALGGRVGRIVLTVDAIINHPAYSTDGSKIAFQIEKPTPQFGGYHWRPGLYWVNASGGVPHFVTAGGFEPVFSPAGDRLYFNLTLQGADRSSILKSVALDGTDPREHVRSTEGHHFRLSPDGHWVAFQENFSLYVAPYLEAGSAMTLSAASSPVPITQLTQHRGTHFQWSGDSQSLNWLSGDKLYSSSISKASGAARADGAPPITLGLEVAQDVPNGRIAFTGARIITMKGAEVIEDGVLVVDRNRIVAIGATGDVTIPKDSKLFNVAGKTIMPGLVDKHAHLLNGQLPEDITPQKFARYYANLAYGVTTTFDPYAPTDTVFRFAEMVEAGRMVGPRIFSTGDALTAYPWSNPVINVHVTSPQSASDHVLRMKEAGAIAIKSYVQPGRVERQELVKACRDLGMLAIPEGEGQFYHDLSMILDGYTTVEHNLPVDTLYDDVVQLFSHSQTAVTPTLMVTQAELNGMQFFYQSTRIWEIDKLRRFTPTAMGWDRAQKPLWAHQRTISAPDDVYDIGTRSVARSLKKLNDAGVLVTMGSHGEIQGVGAIWELWLINQGGMSNHDTLRVGTINGAKTLGMDKDIGSLEVGKLADLIVLDGDPIKDIKALDTVRYTMVNGRLYDSLSMNEIGNYDRPRGKFYWEMDRNPTIDWDESMIGDLPSGPGGTVEPDD